MRLLIESVEQFLALLACDFSDYLNSGINETKFSEADDLCECLGLLRNIYSTLRYEEKCKRNKCFCLSYYQRIKEKVLSIIGFCVNNLAPFEREKKQDFDYVKNPCCLSYESWEKALIEVVPHFEVMVKEKEVCISPKVLFDVVQHKRPELRLVYESMLKPETAVVAESEIIDSKAEASVSIDLKSNPIPWVSVSSKVQKSYSEYVAEYKIMKKNSCPNWFTPKVHSYLCDLGVSLSVVKAVDDVGYELHVEKGDCLIKDGAEVLLYFNKSNIEIVSEVIQRCIIK